MSKSNANAQQPLNKPDQENTNPWRASSQNEFVLIIEAVIKNYGGSENLIERNPQLAKVFTAMEISAIYERNSGIPDYLTPKEEETITKTIKVDKHIAETVIDKLLRETDELLGECASDTS